MTHLKHDNPSGIVSVAERIGARVAALSSELVAIRRHLHANPEPSGEEIETSRYIRDRLSQAGLEPRLGRDGRGVIADVTIGRPHDAVPLIALRADIDALRMQDAKTVEYASRRPTVAHACGHDAHTAMALGAAVVAGQLRHEQHLAPGFAARLRFIFQPAEEIATGARDMIEQGVLDGVEAILALHVDPSIPVQHVGIRSGVLTASCDEVEFVIRGRGGHSARPHDAVDSIATAAELINALYQFLPRSVDSRSPVVFTIGQIQGGYTSNVIPERVELRGSLRTADEPARKVLQRRIMEIAEGISRSSGAKISARIVNSLGHVKNDLVVMGAMQRGALDVVGPDGIQLIERPSMGGEDFAAYLEHVPGALLRLGCARPGGDQPFLHSPHFDFDERALTIGTRILLAAGLDLSSARQSGESEVTLCQR